MNPYSADSVLPHYLQSMHWANKDNFLLSVDIYSNWILFAVEEGSFEFEIGEEKGTGRAGDLVLSPPYIPFRRKIIQNLTFFSINFQWKSMTEYKTITDSRLLSHIPIGKISLRNNERLSSNYDYLRKLQNKHDATSIHRKNHLLNDIWLLYCLEADILKQPKWSPDPLMSIALKLINENCFEYSFSMKNLSDDLGLTPVQFTRKFKTAWGMTPSEFAMELKMDRAKRLLAESTLSLQKIAYLCGFENGNYLSRIFSKKLNIQTTDYRRLHHR